mmetsp:Transcript_39760/g.127834  ORF Transcript_39760/g.127834 Transcript_39760/m.127834 type:complete len:345 (-) Transcript_39760:259-1293(-)
MCTQRVGALRTTLHADAMGDILPGVGEAPLRGRPKLLDEARRLLPLRVARDRQHGRPAVVLEVSLREGEGADPLLLVGALTHPQEDLEAVVVQEDVAGLQPRDRQLRPRAGARVREGAPLSRLEPQQQRLGRLYSRVLAARLLTLHRDASDLDAEKPSLSGQLLPEGVLLVWFSVRHVHYLRPPAPLRSHPLGQLVRLSPLGRVRLAAHPHKHLELGVEDVHVARVHRRPAELDLPQPQVAAPALDLEEARLPLLELCLLEAGRDAALEVLDPAAEQVEEVLRLGPLHLSVLRRSASKEVVQLDRLVRGGAVLVLRRLAADPKVDVPLQLLVVVRLLIRAEHDV